MRHALAAIATLILALACAPGYAGITIESVAREIQPPALASGEYRALLIGNQQYTDATGRWQQLETPASDARALARILTRAYGFNDVQVLENASRRDTLLALHELNQRTRANDNVLIYYAGHGFLDNETGRGFWVPVDAHGDDHTTYLRNSTIRDELSILANRARHTLLISDSCFSGSLLRSGQRGPTGAAGSERYYEQVASRKSVQILSAGGIEYVGDNYRDSGHSPFSYFLINSLAQNEQDALAASELASSVTRLVANNVDQIPQSGVLHGAGDELGEFIFLKIDVHIPGVSRDRVKVQVNVNPEPIAQPATPVETEVPVPIDDSRPVALPPPTL